MIGGNYSSKLLNLDYRPESSSEVGGGRKNCIPKARQNKIEAENTPPHCWGGRRIELILKPLEGKGRSPGTTGGTWKPKDKSPTKRGGVKRGKKNIRVPIATEGCHFPGKVKENEFLIHKEPQKLGSASSQRWGMDLQAEMQNWSFSSQTKEGGKVVAEVKEVLPKGPHQEGNKSSSPKKT